MKDSRRTSSRAPAVAAGVVAVLVLGGGAYYYVTSEDTPSIVPGAQESAAPEETTTIDQEPADPEMQRVTFLLDGWSAQTISGSSLSYITDPDERGIGDEERTVRLEVTPVTEGDLAALAQDTPDILARSAARMITADSDLTCAETGCTADGEEIPLSYFTDPASIPAYGASYEGYGVESVLYTADILVPEGTANIEVRANGYEPYTFAVNSAAEVEGEAQEPSVLDGFGGERLLLSAAFGRFFVPDPAWIVPTDAETVAEDYTLEFVSETSPDISALESYQETPLFAGGLSTPVEEALALGDSKLTSMSSPTVGCEPAVTCVPGTVEVTFDRMEPSSSLLACPSDGSAGESRLVTQTSYWNLTYPAPTHQYGVWNGAALSDFEGYEESNRGLLQGGVPPLVSGEQTLRVASGLFFTDAEEPRLWDIVSYVAQEGEDPAETFEFIYDENNLDTLNGGYFTTC